MITLRGYKSLFECQSNKGAQHKFLKLMEFQSVPIYKDMCEDV